MASLTVGRDIVAEQATPLPWAGLPMNMVQSADGKYAVICGMGYRDALWTLRISDNQVVGRMDFLNRAPARVSPEGPQDDAAAVTPNADNPKKNGLYYGLAIDGNTLYAAQGRTIRSTF